MKHYLFAKFFNHLKKEELMEKCLELGIDGPTLMVRDGFWVTDSDYKNTLFDFVKTAQKYKLEVKYADTGILGDNIKENMEFIKAVADSGIEQFRVSYISRKNFDGRIREILSYAKRNFYEISKVAEENNMQAVVQIHGGQYPHNATSAYECIKDLDPRYIGIKIDPGNNIAQEGYEYFNYQIPLLGEYIAAIGEKDACMVKEADLYNSNSKGWGRKFVPAYQGYTDFEEIFSELKKVDFKGPGILMPFYNNDNYPELVSNLKKEVEYFKKLENQAGL